MWPISRCPSIGRNDLIKPRCRPRLKIRCHPSDCKIGRGLGTPSQTPQTLANQTPTQSLAARLTILCKHDALEGLANNVRQ